MGAGDVTQTKHKLVIPKNVAEVLDARFDELKNRSSMFYRDAIYNAINPWHRDLGGTDLGDWIAGNQEICFGYLAGKELGVEIVGILDE